MTDREKAIVMAYTGIVMLKGDKFKVFHEYVEELFGREVYTHEFLSLHEQIRERSKPDFMKLCAETEKTGKWLHRWDDYFDWYECSGCGYGSEGEVLKNDRTPYCPYCGAKMEVEE